MNLSFYQSVNRMRNPRVLFISLVFACSSQAATAWEFGAELGYHSRYIAAEGVSGVDHGGIGTLDLELVQETEAGDFAVGIEHLNGTAVNFRETAFWAGYERVLADAVTASLSWTRIKEEERDDNLYYSEYTAAFFYNGWDRITPGVEYIYTTNTNGGLLALILESEIEIGGLTLAPYVTAKFDYGYATEDYDGLNHIEAGIAWSRPLPKDVEMTIYAAYLSAQENLRRDDEDNNYFWGGISFSL